MSPRTVTSTESGRTITGSFARTEAGSSWNSAARRFIAGPSRAISAAAARPSQSVPFATTRPNTLTTGGAAVPASFSPKPRGRSAPPRDDVAMVSRSPSRV
jgi:hypothetical protein